ncbi:Thermostable carboxypeptidase 1 [Pseudobythopirellula maris]|uniref:Metal-dependent carboxypeptidase n=1 Tax=Pseudobythopirellula maris TaxID=2527991 RepID=A0A5C5ZNM3_9BACT|nr:carboxypeptidase M32 [Pseudobythopirellula maris]TWT88790.1 Thermostable carboxypeptidase 1 [Pseudobythopirellula maris]
MSAEAAYEKLCEHARQTAVLATALNVLEWDERTQMPRAAGPYRAEQSAYLAGLIHERETDPARGDWLAELVESPLADDPHGDTGCVIRQLKRRFDKKTKLPQKLVEELTRTSSVGQTAWEKAREADDYSLFLPLLEKTIDLKRQEAEAIGYDDSPYDALLDDYEPGETTANVARVLAGLRDRLAPLVAQIAASDRAAPSEIITRHYPAEGQAAFGVQAAAAIGFDFDAGRLDVTAHPFCTGLGPRDTRLTTRYDEDKYDGGLFGILHEAGHGIYDQGMPPELFGLPTGDYVSLGIHESQSRMWENLVGRSQAFWDHFYQPLQRVFPEALADVSKEEFCFAVNESKPSLVRTESDEATYNLHVIVRFELEQALLSGDLKAADLPAAWNAKYKDLLGIEPPSDADGVLQDVHWAAGLFGYFPTYALGNLYASQFFEQAAKELGDLDAMFARGEFAPLREWLREKIHSQGQRYSAAELVERVSGEPLSPEPLMRHLTAKFGGYYGFGAE